MNELIPSSVTIIDLGIAPFANAETLSRPRDADEVILLWDAKGEWFYVLGCDVVKYAA